MGSATYYRVTRDAVLCCGREAAGHSVLTATLAAEAETDEGEEQGAATALGKTARCAEWQRDSEGGQRLPCSAHTTVCAACCLCCGRGQRHRQRRRADGAAADVHRQGLAPRRTQAGEQRQRADQHAAWWGRPSPTRDGGMGG